MSPWNWNLRSDEEYIREAAAVLGDDLVARFGAVQMLVFDADGVLTDGRLIYGPAGEAFKAFHSRDGLGIVMARLVGLKLAVLTGRPSEIVAQRARELNFDAIRIGRFDKVAALEEICRQTGCPPESALFMGDDLVDLPALMRVAVPVAVPEAPAEVLKCACFVSRAPGGEGAVREVVDLVLKAGRRYRAALLALADSWDRPGGGQR